MLLVIVVISLKDSGGVAIMANAVLLGFLWRILKQEKEVIIDEILKYFAKKDIDKEAEKKCILASPATTRMITRPPALKALTSMITEPIRPLRSIV